MRVDPRKLIEALEEAGYEPRSYSGRGMYGRTCVGVTTDRYTPEFKLGVDVALAASAMFDDMDELVSFLEDLSGEGCSTDSMGLGTITYFPSIPWPETDPEFAKWLVKVEDHVSDELGNMFEDFEFPEEKELLAEFKAGADPVKVADGLIKEYNES